MLIWFPPLDRVDGDGWFGTCGIAGGRDVHHRSPFELVPRLRAGGRPCSRSPMPATSVADARGPQACSRALRAENADAAGRGVEVRDAGPERRRQRDLHPRSSLLSRLEGDIALVNEPGIQAVAHAAVK